MSRAPKDRLGPSGWPAGCLQTRDLLTNRRGLRMIGIELDRLPQLRQGFVGASHLGQDGAVDGAEGGLAGRLADRGADLLVRGIELSLVPERHRQSGAQLRLHRRHPDTQAAARPLFASGIVAESGEESRAVDAPELDAVQLAGLGHGRREDAVALLAGADARREPADHDARSGRALDVRFPDDPGVLLEPSVVADLDRMPGGLALEAPGDLARRHVVLE